jgi:L-fuculose-phosphate aldolase
MSASDVCILKLADLSVVEGDRDPSVEAGLHARVLRARKDVRCSIHTHQPIASACALLGKELEVPPELRPSLGRRVPVAGYAPSGSGLLSMLLGRRVRSDVNACLMLNHGVLCCGSSPEDAMRIVEDLESLARAHLHSRIVARAPHVAPLRKALWRVADALTKRHPD